MYWLFFTGELKKWLRDPMMRFMLFYPLLFGVIGRYVLPAIAETASFSIEQNADFIIAALILMTPLIFGAIIGFSVLEDRDDHIIDSVKVTPLNINQFISFRLIIVYLFSFAACIYVMWFSAIGSLPLKDMILIAFLASLSAPMTGLLINVFAHNKIEGFAIMKLIGTIIILPVIALFFTDYKELFFAVIPAFWPAKMISSIVRGEEFMYLGYTLYFWIGLVYVVILNIFSYNRFSRKVAI